MLQLGVFHVSRSVTSTACNSRTCTGNEASGVEPAASKADVVADIPNPAVRPYLKTATAMNAASTVICRGQTRPNRRTMNCQTLKRRLQLIAVGVGDDKAAQDEEEINEEVAVTNEAQGMDMVGRFEMKQHDA